MATTDPNEDYTGILIKDTYETVIHIGGSGSYSGSLFDGTGSLISVNWHNLSSSIHDAVNNVNKHPLNKELLYAGYLGS
jgi:hypothetical protein